MQNLHIDFETRSRVDLKKVGIDQYAHHPSTDILMMAYAFDNSPVQIWLPHVEPLPGALRAALTDPGVRKCAWNVNFEFNIVQSKLGIELDITQWFDPAAHARALGYPANLAEAGDALDISTEHAKSKTGKELLKLFSAPTRAKKPTKKNPEGIPSRFNDWASHPEEWAQLCEYCKQDVIAERAVSRAMDDICPFQEQEQKIWVLDQQINARGIPIDLNFVAKALALVECGREAVLFDLKVLTGCENPNSPEQLKEWLESKGHIFDSLNKECVKEALKNGGLDESVQKTLTLKQELGGIAFKKLPVIQAWTREDRLRYAFLYHSAHTGRWSSKGVQFHNLLKPSKLVAEHYDGIVASILESGTVPDGVPVIEAVAGTLRAAVRARPGNQLYVADYSSIENRVLAWLAQCPGMLDVFAKGLDPYKSFAALQYHKPYDEITKEQRNLCKSPVLGCGFGMGPLRLVGYAAAMGQTLSTEQAEELVYGWRNAYPEVPEYWDILGDASIKAVLKRQHLQIGPLRFDGRDERMFKITLPSGRQLHYIAPKIGRNKFHQPVLTHMADEKIWKRVEARGSSLVENVVQAAARDLLVNGMVNVTAAGFDVVLHVHDELVAEVPLTSELTYATFEECMTTNPPWAPDIPLKVEGFPGMYYKK